jgi:hypothetical protein
MRQSNFGKFHIRKWFLQIESVRAAEHGAMEQGSDPQRKVVLATLMENPYLSGCDDIIQGDPLNMMDLADEFADRLLTALKGRPIRGQGRAFIVGLDGKYQHGAELMGEDFTFRVLARLGGGCSFPPLLGKRGGLRESIDIGLIAGSSNAPNLARDSISASFNDAPGSDEILIAWAISTRDRIVGDRPASRSNEK